MQLSNYKKTNVMKNLISIFAAILFAIFNFPTSASSQLSQSDKDALIFSIQEEKVANNFYVAMEAMYGLNVFRNISGSEVTHMNLVKSLIEKFGIENPVTGNYEAAGSFKDAGLEKIYNDLIKSGSVSATEALKESARFEEMDIRDLKKFTEATDNNDIKNTFNLLINASENHLRAFVRNLESRGINYTPQYLSKDEFDKIISSSNKGNGNRGNCNKGNGNRSNGNRGNGDCYFAR